MGDGDDRRSWSVRPVDLHRRPCALYGGIQNGTRRVPLPNAHHVTTRVIKQQRRMTHCTCSCTHATHTRPAWAHVAQAWRVLAGSRVIACCLPSAHTESRGRPAPMGRVRGGWFRGGVLRVSV